MTGTAEGRLRPATITDVAKLAQVSVGTVSRVMNGAVGVSALREGRVRDAIAELGYRPNASARSLSTARSSMVTVLTGNTSRYGYSETIRGVTSAAAQRGYAVSVVVVQSEEQPAVNRALALLANNATSGLLVLRFDPQSAAAAKLVPEGLPTLVVGDASGAHAPLMIREEEAAACELVEHLLALGHRTVHHVRIPIVQAVSGRSSGWERALDRAGVAAPAVVDVGWDPEDSRAAGRALAADPTVTAVFCGNDESAMGVIRGLADAGLRVPEDVSVVGFDDHPVAGIFVPSLTTVSQQFASLGEQALDALLAMIEGGEPVEDRLSQHPRLVLRESAGPPGR